MAIYHCSVKMIGRNAGRSAVGAVAYRAGEDLVNEYDGVEHDYTKKNWVEYTEIILPKNAPREYQDRGTLWNAVEFAEKAKDAQLCREFEIAIPIEFTKEEGIEVIRKFVAENLTSRGMVADIAIHNPPKTNDRHQPIDKEGNVTRDVNEMQFINPHAHILCTVRPMDAQGVWEKKSEVEYLCKKKDGEERSLTALEFRNAKPEGWEKQYQYYEDGKKVYYTPSEAEQKGLERVNRTPRTTPYGRKNATVEEWNRKEKVDAWRLQWERVVNDKFASLDSEFRIDSRSFKEQGREELPTLHMGVAAINMEKRADREIREGKSEADIARSDIGEINRQIKEYNSFVKMMAQKTKELFAAVAGKLEEVWTRIKRTKKEKEFLISKQKKMEANVALVADALQKYQVGVIKIETTNKKALEEISHLQDELKRCSLFQAKRRMELQNRIKELQEDIMYRNRYKERMEKQSAFKNKDEYAVAVEGYEKDRKECERLEAEANLMGKEEKKLIQEYQSMCNKLPGAIKEEVERVCLGVSRWMKKEIGDEGGKENREDMIALNKTRKHANR